MTSLAISEEHWRVLTDLLSSDKESAVFLLAGKASHPDGTTLLVRCVVNIPPDSFLKSTSSELVIASSGIVPALKAARDDQSVVVFVHTHPGGSSHPSERDEIVDQQLRGPVAIRAGSDIYASLTLGGTKSRPSYTGRVHIGSDSPVPIDRLRVVGRRIQLIRPEGSEAIAIDVDAFDRHIRAFGPEGQRLLSTLRVGVVGLGGTGSAVCEQLVRLGVKHLVLVDDESVTDTNITRIHESASDDIGSSKVALAAARARAIWPNNQPVVVAIEGRITSEDVTHQLTNLDVVFGCTDDQLGRAILSRLAYWYLVPVIDMGFRITSDSDDRIIGLFGRVSTLLPGSACLQCREHISSEGIRLESLPPEQRRQLAEEGYVQNLQGPDPSVGIFTTMTATFALNAFLERLMGYGQEAGASTDLVIRVADLALSRSIARNPWPPSHSRNTSRTSNTGTSRNAMPPLLEPLMETAAVHQQRRRCWWISPGGGPITGGKVVPCCWRNSAQSGPMPLAGDKD